MALSYEDVQIIVIAIIYFFAGGYSLLFGVSSVRNTNLNIPSLNQFGLTISRIIHGKAKVAEKEKELQDPKKLRRYGVLFIFIGIAFIAGGALLVVELSH